MSILFETQDDYRLKREEGRMKVYCKESLEIGIDSSWSDCDIPRDSTGSNGPEACSPLRSVGRVIG